MNKIKHYIILFLFLSLPSLIYADCTQEERDNFKKIESEYKVTYEYDKDSKSYTLYFNNPDYAHYGYKIGYYENSNDYVEVDLSFDIKEFSMENKPAGTYTIEIYGKTDTCNSKMKTFNIKLAKLNPYYDDPLCKGLEDFYLCQPTYDKDIDYDTFVSRINTYKNTLAAEKEKEKKEKSPIARLNKMVDWLREHIAQIAVIIIVVIIIISTIILAAKSVRKSRRLE